MIPGMLELSELHLLLALLNDLCVGVVLPSSALERRSRSKRPSTPPSSPIGIVLALDDAELTEPRRGRV